MILLPAHEYLDKHNIPYARAEFPLDIERGAASVARTLGYNERQMIKTLIFELDTGKRILVMVGGDQNIVSGLLKKAAGSRNIKMANFEAIKETTGYEVGSILPFSWQPEGFHSFLVVSFREKPAIP